MKKILLFLFLSAAAFSSMAEIIIDPAEVQPLLEICKITAKDGYLVNVEKYTKAGLTSGKLLIAEESYRFYQKKIDGAVEKGTRFAIKHVVKDVNFFSSCWYVEIEILSGEYSGQIARLPSCDMDPPSWLSSNDPIYRKSSGALLGIKQEYALSCDTNRKSKAGAVPN